MKKLYIIALLFAASLVSRAADSAKEISLFDGKTFAGWDGDTNKTWRIEDGAIVGGSLSNRVVRNEFLCVTRAFTNFTIRVKFKLVATEGSMNGGVQFGSERITNPTNEMSGYQADLGDPDWWGALYDESRRNTVLARPEPAVMTKAYHPGEWNEYLIRCEGKHIQGWINGIQTFDYTEPDAKIVQHGRIGLQVHGGAKQEARYKDIFITELP